MYVPTSTAECMSITGIRRLAKLLKIRTAQPESCRNPDGRLTWLRRASFGGLVDVLVRDLDALHLMASLATDFKLRWLLDMAKVSKAEVVEELVSECIHVSKSRSDLPELLPRHDVPETRRLPHVGNGRWTLALPVDLGSENLTMNHSSSACHSPT